MVKVDETDTIQLGMRKGVRQMRTVLRNHDEVCHVWAQQKQSQGKSGNIFFDGVSIYSYGRHFEMARFVDAETVFITVRRYSVSTAKHLGLVHRAVTHKTVFCVPSFTDHRENLVYLIDQAKDSYDEAKRARKYAESCIDRAKCYVDEARQYMTKFQGEVPDSHRELWLALHTETYLNSEVQAQLLAKARAAQAAEREATKQARLQREAEQAAQLEKWIAGELEWGRFSAMRLRVKDDEVQTTHGAAVPLIEARKLYRALKAGLNVAGQHIGHYTVTRVTETEMIIGCHNIPLSEIERIAPEVMSKSLVEA